MAKELEAARRVTFQVTGYLKGGHPRGGWYDMRAMAGESQEFCIPEGCVEESTVTDAPEEELTRDDWAEIEGTIIARLGQERGLELLRRIHFLAEAFHRSPPKPGVRAWLIEAVLAQNIRLGPNALHTARRGEPIRLSGGEAEELTERILAVLDANPTGKEQA